MVLFGGQTKQQCVLTAGHCVDGLSYRSGARRSPSLMLGGAALPFRADCGGPQKKKAAASLEVHAFSKADVLLHPAFFDDAGMPSAADLAVVRLRKRSKVRPAPVDLQKDIEEASPDATVVGFGVSDAKTGYAPCTVHAAKVPLHSAAECDAMPYGRTDCATECRRMICAGEPTTTDGDYWEHDPSEAGKVSAGPSFPVAARRCKPQLCGRRLTPCRGRLLGRLGRAAVLGDGRPGGRHFVRPAGVRLRGPRKGARRRRCRGGQGRPVGLTRAGLRWGAAQMQYVRLSSKRQKRWLRELKASGLCSIKGLKPARKEADARAAVLLEPLPELFAYMLPIFTFEFRCAGQAGAGFETVYLQGGDRRVVRLSELCAAADAAVIVKVNPNQIQPRDA